LVNIGESKNNWWCLLFSAWQQSNLLKMLEDEEKTKKRVQGEEKQQLLEVLANYSISVSGHPLSQDLINIIL
jgi:hypothetical protein